MTTIGYVRVSTKEQNPNFQINLLQQAGCYKIFVDHGHSSRTMQRPQWQACLQYLRTDDTLLVWKLDRVAGSEKHVLEIINTLGEKQINIRSLVEPQIDTTTAMGKALFGIVAVFAQLRVDTIRENTMAGLANARSNGRVGGRPTVMTNEKLVAAKTMYASGSNFTQIAKALGVTRTTISNHLQN